MIINSLSVLDFRNIGSLQVKFNARLNIIIGDNGHGKTNVVEAINLLTSGESFRYCKNENLIQLGKLQAHIYGKITNKNLDYEMSLKLIANKKDFLVNGKIFPLNLITKFSSVLFSPESLNIIKNGADERRLLIDQLVEQTSANGISIIRDYKKVIKTRNRLLKDIAENKIKYQLGLDTLESINPSFLKLAAELTALRIGTLIKIKPEVEAALIKIHSDENIKFDFDYIISEKSYKNSDLIELTEALRKRMNELEAAELKIGVSLVGPQKHDVIFLYNGNNSRFYCSQGQQRSIILAYKMAQIVYHQRVQGFYPLLLLDDVLSELDLLKQESLISTLNQTETQTFVTTTDISLLSKLSMDNASVFKIKHGQIQVMDK